MDNLEKIRQAGAKYKPGTLGSGIAAMLLKIADSSETAAEIIAQDLDVKEMNIAAAQTHLTNYARKHKDGNSFYMNEKTAEKLLREFYKLPDEPEAQKPKEQPKKPSRQHGKIVDLFDLL